LRVLSKHRKYHKLKRWDKFREDRILGSRALRQVAETRKERGGGFGGKRKKTAESGGA